MPFVLVNLLVTGPMFLGILATIRLGAYLAHRQLVARTDGEEAPRSSVNGAVYALLGLLIAFSFSGALERFSGRRSLIVEEANAIGTAYYRIDLLPDADRAAMRERFRRYLDARLEAYELMPDMEAALAGLARSTSMQDEIWAAAQAGAAASSSCALLLLPALNAMFDIAATRLAATEQHPPLTIYGMIILLALVSGLLVGHSMGSGMGHHRLHAVIYAGVITATVFLSLDLEYPRHGLIRVDDADQVLRSARAAMK